MLSLPNCPKCNSEYTYEDGSLLICPECAHEWTLDSANNDYEDEKVVKDANGNILNDGDSVTIIKDLKVKGSSSALKQGTKVKNKNVYINKDILIDILSGKYGATAISKGRLPALGIPSPGPIDKYINTVNILANTGFTLFAKLVNPPDFATAITPSTGNPTAVIKNALIAIQVFSPAA